MHSPFCNEQMIKAKDEKDQRKNKEENDQMRNSKGRDSSQNDGNGFVSVFIICICTLAGFLIVALIVIVALVKRRRAKENDKDVEEKNDMYGRNDPEEYYELGKNTEIRNRNEYYYGK